MSAIESETGKCTPAPTRAAAARRKETVGGQSFCLCFLTILCILLLYVAKATRVVFHMQSLCLFLELCIFFHIFVLYIFVNFNTYIHVFLFISLHIAESLY